MDFLNKRNKYLNKLQFETNTNKKSIYRSKIDYYNEKIGLQLGGNLEEAKKKFGSAIFNYLKIYIEAVNPDFFTNPQTSRQNYKTILGQLVTASNTYKTENEVCDKNITKLVDRLHKLSINDKGRVGADTNTDTNLGNVVDADTAIFMNGVKGITELCVKVYINNDCDIMICTKDEEANKTYTNKINININTLYSYLVEEYKASKESGTSIARATGVVTQAPSSEKKIASKQLLEFMIQKIEDKVKNNNNITLSEYLKELKS